MLLGSEVTAVMGRVDAKAKDDVSNESVCSSNHTLGRNMFQLRSIDDLDYCRMKLCADAR